MILTGPQLKQLRTEADLTQQHLADLVGVSQAHIAKIEKGKVDPRLSTVNKILAVLTEGIGRKSRDIMTKAVVFAKPSDTVLAVSKTMMEKAISQLPVKERGKIIGTVTEESIIRNLHTNIAGNPVAGIMDPPLPTVPENTDISIVRQLLEAHPGVLITKKGGVVGIITRSDLFKVM